MTRQPTYYPFLCLTLLMLFMAGLSAPRPATAFENGSLKQKFIQKLIERKKKQQESGSQEGFYVRGTGRSVTETLDGRDLIVYLPPSHTPAKKMPLLIALHGGFGNAGHIQKYIGLDPLADQHGFVIAYLNGTQVARKLPAKFQGWNAGGCCGQPQAKNVDDVGFIANVINLLHQKYGIDTHKTFGTGHSNGAMMTQRVTCETNLYKDAITLSGTLQMDLKTCPYAKGSRIMNVHGAEDYNLPVAGGHTIEGINKMTDYKSQDNTRNVFKNSGVNYELLLLKGADHSPETMNEVLIKEHGMTLPQKIVSYLNLD